MRTAAYFFERALSGTIIVVGILFGAFTARAEPATAVSAEERAAIVKERQLGLAYSDPWLRLLLYRQHIDGLWVSQVDDDAFFLSPRGRANPQAELEATLHAFFAPVVAGAEDAHALCRFAARRAWVEEQLVPRGSLPRVRCPKLTSFQEKLDAASVSIVYAANYLSNPASAFGHTFMRIDRRTSNGPGGSGGTGVSYMAKTDTGNPLLYAFKGLGGLFPAYFTFEPYDAVAARYTEDESRDLWEYKLALEPSEIRLLVLHLWELSEIRIQYLYLTENCSYHVLAALEAASPRFDLLSKLNVVVLPGDTIRALTDSPGLVRGVDYHPSLRSRRTSPATADKAPDRGHGSMRVTLGTGATTQYGTGFATFGYRLAMHDLADPADGTPELVQLEILDAQVRLDLARRVLTLDHLTFAEVMSLTPLTSFEKRPSWRAVAFGTRLHDRGCPDCFAHGIEGGLGLTLATRDGRAALFAMADAYIAFSAGFDGVGGSFVRIGAGPYGGLRLRLPGRTLALLTGSVSYLPGQDLSSTYDLRASVRTELGKNVAVGVQAAKQPLSMEAFFSSYFYF
ncbi:DUF4105 domain-containing protein [Pendulispora albinea]|uniref:DUF4105 domain-containing protein n=1 Tax=Pendulispora albinea TaxID=2741071 RepID=A0ABZ2LZU9_9BACT